MQPSKQDILNFTKILKKVDVKLSKIEKELPKLARKRDLAHINEVNEKNIKELQSNNTKKIKTIRDMIDSTNSELNKIKNRNRNAIEEAEVQSQLGLLNETNPDD